VVVHQLVLQLLFLCRFIVRVVAVVAAMCSSGILVDVGRLFGVCLAVALKLQLCLFFRDVILREVYFELWEGEYVVVDAESMLRCEDERGSQERWKCPKVFHCGARRLYLVCQLFDLVDVMEGLNPCFVFGLASCCRPRLLPHSPIDARNNHLHKNDHNSHILT
jgi:hypothetical protein